MRYFYRFELYELLGMAVCAAALVVFFASSQRLYGVLGTHAFHWRILSEIVGVYQNPLTWVFTAVLLALFLLLGYLQRQQNISAAPTLAFLVRVGIAFCTMLMMYKVVTFYTAVFNPFDRDYELQQIDRVLFFGKLPAQWMSYILCRPLTYLLSAAYMSWFFLTYGTALLMLLHSRRAATDFLLTALATFYIGYATYMLVPAVGPLFTVPFAHHIGGLGAAFASHQQPVLARDCFPSLHTGISVVMLVHVWRYCRKWMWLYGPLTFLIVWSTVYLRFHYGIDVIAGAALALVTTQLCPLAAAWWEAKRRPHGFAQTEIKAQALSAQTRRRTAISKLP